MSGPVSFAAFIADPTLPLPAKMSRRQKEQVETLREAYRTAMTQRPPREGLSTPEAIAAYMAPIAAGLSVERLWLIPMDAGNRPLSAPVVLSQGYVDGTDASPQLILRAALLAGAVGFVLVHNHPSGDATPSAADRAVTTLTNSGAKAVGLRLLDHLVIGDAGKFTSIRRTTPSAFY